MAEITQPNIVGFLADERTTANALYHTKAVWQDLKDRWFAQGIGSDLALLDDADTITDNAETNGWEVATVEDMKLFMSRIDQLLVILDAPFAMDVVNKIRTQAVS